MQIEAMRERWHRNVELRQRSAAESRRARSSTPLSTREFVRLSALVYAALLTYGAFLASTRLSADEFAGANPVAVLSDLPQLDWQDHAEYVAPAP